MSDIERIDIANLIGLVIVQLRLRSITYDQAVEQLGYVQFRLDHPNWHVANDLLRKDIPREIQMRAAE